MKFVLALDQGTSSSRAIVFDEEGSIRALAQKELPQIFPQPGWVEHDPLAIWNDQLAVAREAIARAGLSARDIAAIGIANQRETTVLWDRRTGTPIANAIVWQDRRTAPACERLKAAGAGEFIRARTGLVLDPYFSATKIAWLLDHVPDARARAGRGELACGTIDTWLAWKLSGGRLHVTEPSNASRTMLFDIHAGRWDEELAALFGVPMELLPKVSRSSGIYAESTPELFGAPIALGGIAGDQQAALFGQGCHAPGMIKNTYGTGCFMLAHTGAQPLASNAGLLTTCAARSSDDPEYALEGSVFVAGAAVQWLRDALGILDSAAQVEALAAQVEDSGGVVFVPAFTGLGAPYWDASARGTIVGLTRGTGRAHLCRAVLEAIACQSAELAQSMRSHGAGMRELRVDGGASANALLMQLQADLLGVPVARGRIKETTALGAAALAGLAAGVWPSSDAIRDSWKADRVFEPRMDSERAQAMMATWRAAVRCARGWSAARG